MQLIAMLTMLIDHTGYIFFPEQPAWRYIGRIAFPLYCYLLVQGHLHTSSRPRYLFRLLLIAVASQIPYNFALAPFGLNVVFTLLVSAAVLSLLDWLPHPAYGIPAVLAALWVMDRLPFDYNAYGLLLVLVFRYLPAFWTVAGHLALNFIYLFYYGWAIQMFSLLPTLVIAFGGGVETRLNRIKPPRWVWRVFYPAHLALLAAVKWIVW